VIVNNTLFKSNRCFKNGRRIVVVPKASSSEDGTWMGIAMNAWSGDVLECKICGVIYRSRQHWYGNPSPEAMTVVQTEISHIWPGVRTLQGTACKSRTELIVRFVHPWVHKWDIADALIEIFRHWKRWPPYFGWSPSSVREHASFILRLSHSSSVHLTWWEAGQRVDGRQNSSRLLETQ